MPILHLPNKELLGLHASLEDGFSEVLHRRELEVQNDLTQQLSHKRKLLSFLCRVKWLEHRDRNIRFFHGLIAQRKARSGLHSIFCGW